MNWIIAAWSDPLRRVCSRPLRKWPGGWWWPPVICSWGSSSRADDHRLLKLSDEHTSKLSKSITTGVANVVTDACDLFRASRIPDTCKSVVHSSPSLQTVPPLKCWVWWIMKHHLVLFNQLCVSSSIRSHKQTTMISVRSIHRSIHACTRNQASNPVT